jgi:hypothetical protein
MIGTKKSEIRAPIDNAKTQVQPASDMRSDLGLFGDYRVKRAERNAKTDAAVSHVRRAVEIGADVASTQLELDATILKSALVARAAPVVGSILAELIARAGQVTLHVSALTTEGMFQAIAMRRAVSDEIKRRQAAGELTDEEAAGARAYVDLQTQRNCARLDKNSEAALDAIDGHVARATDHVRNSKLG